MELAEALFLAERSRKKYMKSLIPLLEELSQRRDSNNRISSDIQLCIPKEYRKIVEQLFSNVATKKALGIQVTLEEELVATLKRGLSGADYTPLVKRAVELGIYDEMFVKAEKERLLTMYGEGIIPPEVVNDLS